MTARRKPVSNMLSLDNDPALTEKELREMIWALELAVTRPVDAAAAAEIWREVKQRADAGARVREGLRRGLRFITAVLVPESLVLSPAVRGGESAMPRLMVYETEEFAVSLAFSSLPESTRVSLTGQVVPRSAQHLPEGGRVEVWSGNETSAVALNEHGEFAFDDIRHGDLHMDITLGGETIQISPIHTRVTPITES